MKGKIYFAAYLINQKKNSWFYRNLFRAFGAKIGNNVVFANKPEVCGYIDNISIGYSCLIDKNVVFVVNKEGKLEIGNNTLLSYNTILNAGTGSITIGSNIMIAANTYIITNDHNVKENLSVRNSSHIIQDVVIEDNVWIGCNCSILKGVTIGEGSVIGAGSVVIKDIPPYSIAVGAPCKVIKKRYDKDILINKLKNEGYDLKKIDNIIESIAY
ncbi:acyltransferase [Clostridium sporogenes]|uniref:acyltransferase n=1 Tax=Clostridium sporogenes TaxID=1509 RepID=UPI002904AAC9|nr:acyltransferase [Clostridium botulinum]